MWQTDALSVGTPAIRQGLSAFKEGVKVRRVCRYLQTHNTGVPPPYKCALRVSTWQSIDCVYVRPFGKIAFVPPAVMYHVILRFVVGMTV